MKKLGYGVYLLLQFLFLVFVLTGCGQNEPAGGDKSAGNGKPAISRVNAVAFSHDGKTLAGATGGSGFETVEFPVEIWSMPSATQLHSLSGHNYFVNSISFSPDGKTMATGGGDKFIKLWNLASGKLLRTLPGCEGVCWSVVFSPDGKTIAVGGKTSGSDAQGVLKILDAANGKEIATLPEDRESVFSVAFSPDGKILASSAGFDKESVKLWNVVSGKKLRTINESGCRSVAFSPDGKTIATGKAFNTHGHGSIKIWNVKSGKEEQSFEGHKDSTHCLCFSSNGKHIASGGEDHELKIWDVSSGKMLQRVKCTSNVLCVAFSPDGKMVAAGGEDGTLKLWNVSTGKELQSLLPPKP